MCYAFCPVIISFYDVTILREVELGIAVAADTERHGVDMEAVCTVIAGKRLFGHDCVEELDRAVCGDRVERPAQRTSSLRYSDVTPSPRSRSAAMPKKNFG